VMLDVAVAYTIWKVYFSKKNAKLHEMKFRAIPTNELLLA